MAGKKTRKCHWCGLDDTLMEEMEFDTVGVKRPIKKFYHRGECWDAYMEEKRFKQKEQEEKDKLNEFLVNFYGLHKTGIPGTAWTLLENLRNGNPVFNDGKSPKQQTKRYKEGYDYPLILETFDYITETLEYAHRTVPFDGFMGKFKYALRIVIDKIYLIESRREKREKQKENIERHIENIKVEDHIFETNYKKPAKSDTDISDFLDD
ncbi:hypothetical protein [Bacillus mojavensis]